VAGRPRRWRPLRDGALTNPRSSAAFVQLNIVALTVSEVDLTRTRDALLFIVEHLFPLSEPAGHPPDGEEHREEIHRETHRLVDEPRIKVDVRIELSLAEIIILKGEAFELDRGIDEGVCSDLVKDLIGKLLDDGGARIVVLINAMAEAHQASLALLYALEEARDVRFIPDLLKHPDDRLVRASMKRAIERGACSGSGAIGIDAARADVSHGARRAVLLVVGVQNEEHIERTLDRGIR